MKHFYIFGIILILVFMLFKVFVYWRFRRKIKANLVELIRLEGYKKFSQAYLFTAFCMLFCLYFSFWGNRSEETLIFERLFWALAFIFHFINTFIEPQNYFLMNEQGFKRFYIRKWIQWEKVGNLEVKERGLIIVTAKKQHFLAFDDRSAINHFIVELKRFRPELYHRYLINLNNA